MTLANPAGNTAGTWSWANPDASVGNAGTFSFTATFTPSSTNYKSVSSLTLYVTVLPADQDTPTDAPTQTNVTANSVTLSAVDGYEYSKDGTNWQSSPSFTGLKPSTTYTFYQRVKGDDNHNPSPKSPGLSVTTQTQYFKLWIGETQVTSDTPSATGWSCDAETNTLTLDGLVLPTKGRTISGNKVSGIAYLESGTLNLVVLSENLINFTDSSKTCYGLYTTGAFNISGTGSLEQRG